MIVIFKDYFLYLLEVILYSELVLFDEDLLECYDVVLFIEH